MPHCAKSPQFPISCAEIVIPLTGYAASLSHTVRAQAEALALPSLHHLCFLRAKNLPRFLIIFKQTYKVQLVVHLVRDTWMLRSSCWEVAMYSSYLQRGAGLGSARGSDHGTRFCDLQGNGKSLLAKPVGEAEAGGAVRSSGDPGARAQSSCARLSVTQCQAACRGRGDAGRVGRGGDCGRDV